jgi:hypothetical protein
MNAEEITLRMMARELQRQVNRRYDSGGHMIALTALTIEVEGEPLIIPRGHHLTREQALNYPGDVLHVFRQGEASGEGIPNGA